MRLLPSRVSGQLPPEENYHRLELGFGLRLVLGLAANIPWEQLSYIFVYMLSNIGMSQSMYMCVCVCIGVYILVRIILELQTSLNIYIKHKLYTFIFFSFFLFLLIQSKSSEKLFLYSKICKLLCVFRYQKKQLFPLYYLVFTRTVLVQVSTVFDL